MFKGKYSDYLNIDKDFQPVFNEEIDRTKKELWKSFIPHENFSELLEITIKALDREKISDMRSIWLFGSYGTGKTHAVFVLKHLLEDEDDEVEDYIIKRGLDKFLSDKLRAIRQNEKVLVVFKSGAGHVDKPSKLLLEIQDTIYRAYVKYLTQKGIEYAPTETEIQLLRERLEDKVINWNLLIEKYNLKLKEVTSLDDLKKKLSEEQPDFDFIGRLLEVLEEEGIIIKFDTKRLKEWIKEIFNTNHVSRIVFIWDEFSGFFKPGAPLDTLQEIAHLTQEVPFYLLIVTHRRPEHWTQTLTEDVSKLKDRFHYIHYLMEPNTIYQLISNVVYPKKDEIWSSESEKIWQILEFNFSLLQNDIQELIGFEGNVNLETFKRLLPIHPYSAFISSRIVENFGSTQRTLFQFLKTEEKASFPEFLREYPTDDYYLLTPDFLWDYFFVNSREISEFHPEVITILNYWNSWKDHLENEEERRVLKFVLLLITLNQRIQTNEKILRPFYSTIEVAFSGVPVYRRLNQILDSLTKKQVLKELKTTTDKEYLILTHEIDHKDLERVKKDFSDFSKFIKSIRSEIEDIGIHRRVQTKVVSSEDILKDRIPKIEVATYQIPLILTVMREMERVEDLKKRIEELANQHPNTLFVISYIEFGSQEWNSVIENLAYEELFRKSNKEKEAKLYRDQVNEITRKWLDRVIAGRFGVITKIGVDDAIIRDDNISGLEGLRSFSKEIVEKIFPYGLDNLILNEPLWVVQNSKEGLEVGLLHFKSKVTKHKWAALYERFVEKDRILDFDGNFTAEGLLKRNYPLCKMREAVKRLFDETESVSLFDVWGMLQEPPFGLYNSPLASFVLGLVMRDYSKGYFATDGNIVEEVSPQGMVNYLLDTIRGHKEWKLQKLSPEQELFCKTARTIFKLSDERARAPKSVIISIRNKIKTEFKYPLWVLKYTIEQERNLDFEDLNSSSILLLDTLDSIIKEIPEENAKITLTEDTKDKIERFVSLINQLNEYDKKLVVDKLKGYAIPEKFEVGFKEFVSRSFLNHNFKKPEDLSYTLLEQKFRDRMQEEPWAWDEEKAKKVLKDMVIEMEISIILSECIGVRDYFMDDLTGSFHNKVQKTEILPLWFYKYHPSVNREIESVIVLIDKLNEVDVNSYRSFSFTEFLELLVETKEEIKKIFSEQDVTIRSWVLDNIGSNLIDEELEILIRKIKKLFSENPEINESQLLDLSRKLLNELKITSLKNGLKRKLEEIFGTSDISKFYRESFIPLVVVKYLPEFKNFNLPVDLTLDEFLKDLIKFEKLSKDKLETYLVILENNFEILKTLKHPETPHRLLKAFLSKDWIGRLFNEDDLEDFKSYLINKLSGKVELWNEMEIRNAFMDWRSLKYKDRFYPRMVDIIDNMGENEAKNLIRKIIEYPDIGLKVLEIFREANQNAKREN